MKKDKILGGVISSLSDVIGIDPMILRTIVVFLSLVTWVVPMVYVIAWIVSPE